MRTLLLLPFAALARTPEQVGMMQVTASAQLLSMGKGTGTAAENMLQQMRDLAKKNEKPSEETLNTLGTIRSLVEEILGNLVAEQATLQGRATNSASAILACDASWESASVHKQAAEETMNDEESAHVDCRTLESQDLADQTTHCTAMTNVHAAMAGHVCVAPTPFDRHNSETYMTCVHNFWTTYASEDTQTIAACEDSEAEYTRQKTECNTKQTTFEEAACARYTTHAAMCSAYSDCRPAAVADFEARTAAIGLEENSIKNQNTVLKTVECYVEEMLSDDSDTTAVALSCEGQDHATSDFDITYPEEPAEKPCTVASRPCETAWTTSYSELPADAPAGECAACPAYSVSNGRWFVAEEYESCNTFCDREGGSCNAEQSTVTNEQDFIAIATSLGMTDGNDNDVGGAATAGFAAACNGYSQYTNPAYDGRGAWYQPQPHHNRPDLVGGECYFTSAQKDCNLQLSGKFFFCFCDGV